MMRKSVKAMMLGIYLSSIMMVGAADVCLADEKFQISGYGNAHLMDHSGLPKLLDMTSGLPKDNPNDTFTQIRDFHSSLISLYQRVSLPPLK